MGRRGGFFVLVECILFIVFFMLVFEVESLGGFVCVRGRFDFFRGFLIVLGGVSFFF